MKSKFLFPTWCSIVGYLLAIPGFVLGYLNIFKKYEIPNFGFQLRAKDNLFEKAVENFTNELAIFLVVIGLVLIAFSKNKREDELSARIRLNALYWSVMIYYVLYCLALLYSMVIGEIPFVGDHASELNIFTPLVIFVIRYSYLKSINKESYLISQPKFLSNKPYRKLGVFLSLAGLAYFIIALQFDPQGDWVFTTTQAVYLIFMLGLLLWTFSQFKTEDEMIMQQRLESLQLAVYFNYLILLVATMVFYSFVFLYVLTIAQFSLLVFFIIRMEYISFKNKQSLNAMEEDLTYEK
ncbi:hypothetical protein [Pedobacter sp. Hv1]|uniref:hypothetical protein n=1 Tax=Pedobacter sp. Hv1 TaxID=1740090 RepID=UPI0006D8C254|nr:hypothetical protein [Pedobacter sp. Hv1]KQB99163.1 hypothetical protein AQF98_16400 [Pedobacter sp. Hv1]